DTYAPQPIAGSASIERRGVVLGDRGLAEQHLHFGVEVRRGLHLELRTEGVHLLPLRRDEVRVDRRLAREVLDQRRELADRARSRLRRVDAQTHLALLSRSLAGSHLHPTELCLAF